MVDDAVLEAVARAWRFESSSRHRECSLNEQFNKISWNWNKFGSGSRNLGDLLYLMRGESALKSSALNPPNGYFRVG